MKAIVYTEYGSPDVLHLADVEKPAPKDHEILIKIHATSVNYGDIAARNFKAITPQEFNMLFIFWLMAKISFGLIKPKNPILGNEFAGEIESVGKDVQRFKKGDQVFGTTGQNMGTYAEYLCMPEGGCVALKPANMTFEDAAVVAYDAVMALNLLEKANIQPGQRVLINGASGGIGSAAVQITRHHFGADVTGVCGPLGLEYVKSLGANKVIDYTKEDFTLNGETYDLILDILGKSSFSRSKNSLSPRGILLFASFKMGKLLDMLWTTKTGSKKVICAIAPGSREDLITVKQLIEAEKIKTIIDKYYPMEQTAEAHRYVEQGKKRGKVVIMIK